MSRKKDIGLRIKVMRMSRNMSQIDLANALDCAQSTIAMWETGNRTPDIDIIDFLADIFNVPPYAILYSEDEIEKMIGISKDYTDDEMKLLWAYRSADGRAREDALNMLLSHPAQKKENRA